MIYSRNSGSQICVEFLLEVDLFLVLVWNDCFVAWLPVSGADITVFISMLECLNQTNGLIDATTNSIIIDLHGAKFALSINDEDTTKGSSEHGVFRVLYEHIIVA